MNRRKPLFIVFLAFFGCFLSAGALAHHGWGWATGEEFQITGEIIDIRLGNPHGEVDLQVDDALWIIEVGQPWRNDRAGLTNQLVKGRTVTVLGHRSANEAEKLVKAERLVIDDTDYVLYRAGES